MLAGSLGGAMAADKPHMLPLPTGAALSIPSFVKEGLDEPQENK